MNKKGYKTKLSNIALVTQGQSPESNYYSNIDGVPFLQGNRSFGNLYPTFDTFTLKVTKLAIKGDVLMSVRAPVGALNYAPCDLCIGRGLASLRAKNGNNHFVYYALKYNVSNLIKQGSATTFDSVNKDIINDFELIVPEDESERVKITKVLSDLDTKIELNNKVNRELEAMAKTLYDYWFVQFDFPDANGRPYKSSGGKMVYNAELKREIPEGWCIEKLPKCCSIIDCLHSKKPDFHFENEKYYLLQLENLKDDGLIDSTNKYFVTKNDYDNWTSRIEVRENDIVITNAGRVGATAQIPKGMVAGIGRNITAIRPFSISPTYLFLAFRGIDMRRQIAWNTDQGAFFTSLNVKGIKQLFIVRPPFGIESEFEKNVLAIRTKRELIQRQNQHLTALRDWLLPMLMNGQVRVKEAALRQAQDEISMAAEPSVKYGN